MINCKLNELKMNFKIIKITQNHISRNKSDKVLCKAFITKTIDDCWNKEMLKNVERHVICMDWKLTIIKISIISKAKYRFSIIPIKTPVDYFEDIGKMIQKLIRKCNNFREARTVLKKENEVIGLSLLDFNIDCKATIIKAIWFWCKEDK